MKTAIQWMVGVVAIAALGLNFFDVGVQTGRMAARILKGEAPGAIPSETNDNLLLFLNPKAAAAQGVTLSDALIQSATQIVQ